MEQTYTFQTRLFKQLNGSRNIFFSPVSIIQALSLAANGAVGETQTNMLSTLDTSNIQYLNSKTKEELALMSQEKSISYSIANAILTKDTPSEVFKEIAVNIYQADVNSLESAEQVNKWCSLKTNGKITKILQSVNEEIRMIILNAVYFSGQWEKSFTIIGERNFYLKNDSYIKASFMRNKIERCTYASTTSAELIGLSINWSKFIFYIILPKGDIDEYLSAFSDQEFKSLTKDAYRQKIQLTMPKFEIVYEVSLKSALEALGMSLVFGSGADFSGITKEAQLFIDNVIHKTYIKVDENGLEAAAVTADVMFNCTSVGYDVYKDVIVDRPFIVTIKHSESDNFLFIGKIENVGITS
jgi:serpin B